MDWEEAIYKIMLLDYGDILLIYEVDIVKKIYS